MGGELETGRSPVRKKSVASSRNSTGEATYKIFAYPEDMKAVQLQSMYSVRTAVLVRFFRTQRRTGDDKCRKTDLHSSLHVSTSLTLAGVLLPPASARECCVLLLLAARCSVLSAPLLCSCSCRSTPKRQCRRTKLDLPAGPRSLRLAGPHSDRKTEKRAARETVERAGATTEAL